MKSFAAPNDGSSKEQLTTRELVTPLEPRVYFYTIMYIAARRGITTHHRRAARRAPLSIVPIASSWY